MGKSIYIYTSLFLTSVLLAALTGLYSEEPGYREKVLKYIEKNQPKGLQITIAAPLCLL